MSARSTPTRRSGGVWGATVALAGRELRRSIRQPASMIIQLLQPILFLVLLDAVFGQVIDLPDGVERYVDLLAPALAVFAIFQAGLPSGLGLCEDLASGITDRLRATAGGGVEPLLARVLVDVGRAGAAVVTILVIGMLLGFRPAGPAAVIGFVGLGVLLGTAFTWLWLALALGVRSTEAFQPLGSMLSFVLLFLSASLAPVSSFPGWLQPIVRVNPLTTFSAAMRDLGGGAVTAAVGRSILIVAAAWVIFGALAVGRWRRE